MRFTINLIKLAWLVMLGWVAGFICFLYYLPVSSGAASSGDADAIVVLTGGSQRIEKGISLLKDNRAPRLFISGVGKDVKLPELLEAAGAGNQIDNKNFCARIALDYESESTMQNGVETAKWLKQNNIKSIILVTAHYHMPRAIMEMRANAKNVKITQIPVFPFASGMGEAFANKGILGTIWNEYNKLLFAMIRTEFG